ncbi:hypothetical protein [Novosphingobium sp. THN1]|uniref:hypothetical protein n=1 Tax=Novosphingobium sp. THN1 TaxID=1016987 RepID=UPI0013C2FB5C|nr:hypothetical protein [Novosphingobium sp. THN1]
MKTPDYSPDYKPDYRVTTILRDAARPVVRLFISARHFLNGAAGDYGSQMACCSHHVVTRKAAENRHFSGLTTLTTLQFIKRKNGKKSGLYKDTRARRSHVGSLGAVVA